MKKRTNPFREQDAIARAYKMIAAEMGHVAAASAMHEQIVKHYGSESARWFLRKNSRAFPILAAMADDVDTSGISKCISDLNKKLSTLIRSKTDIICVGSEAAWLDVAAPMHPDKIFHVVPHSSDADCNRIISNYPDNVHLHDSIDLTCLSGTDSVIVIFAFGVSEHTFYTYRVTNRICGRDTRQMFSALIALDMIDCPLQFCPPDLVEIATDEITHLLSRSFESKRRDRRWKSAAF